MAGRGELYGLRGVLEPDTWVYRAGFAEWCAFKDCYTLLQPPPDSPAATDAWAGPAEEQAEDGPQGVELPGGAVNEIQAKN